MIDCLALSRWITIASAVLVASTRFILPGLAQERAPVIAKISVLHVHNSGWSSHSLELSVTSESMLISGAQKFRDSTGNTQFCSLPAEIPLEDVINIGTRSPKNRLSFSNVHATRLHIEFKDGKSKNRELEFVSRTSVQRQNDWEDSRSRGNDLEVFVQAVQGAAELRRKNIAESAPRRIVSSSRAIPLSSNEDRPGAGPVPRTLQNESGQSAYAVQRLWKGWAYRIVVWPVSPNSPARTLIEGSGSIPEIDVGTEDISSVEVRQHVVRLEDPNTLIQIGGPPGPKIYELCLKIRQANGKTSNECFISDAAACSAGKACEEGPDAGKKVRDLADALKYAIAQRSEQIEREAHAEMLRRAEPSGLTASVVYDDSQSLFPDGRIDAGKQGSLVISVENRGPGTAYSVVASASCNQRNLSVAEAQQLGDIPSGQKREARIPVRADLGVPNGQVILTVRVREGTRDYAAHPVNLSILTAALNPSNLSIDRFGNDNPRNGETFELVTRIHNQGTSPAMGVVLSLAGLPPGIEPVVGSATVGTIPAGETAQATLSFNVPRTWSGGRIEIGVKAIDARGESAGSASRSFSLTASLRSPRLSVAQNSTLVNGKAVTEIENGQTGIRTEITVRNDGDLAAENVNLRLHAAGIEVQPHSVQIGGIKPHDIAKLQFRFSIPRGFPSNSITFVCEVSENGFVDRCPDLPVLAVLRHSPRLQADLVAVGATQSHTLQQNQTIPVELRLTNYGDLSADGVVVKFDTGSPDIKAIGLPDEIRYASISPNKSVTSRFSLHVGESARIGELPVRVSVSQADFPPQNNLVPLHVSPEQITTVSAAPTIRPPSLHHAPPTVSIIQPGTGTQVWTAEVGVVASISTESHVSRVALSVNHMNDDYASNLGNWRLVPTSGPEMRTIDIPVHLDEGMNTIELFALDEEGQSSNAIVNLTMNSKPLRDAGNQRLEVVALATEKSTTDNAAGIFVGKDHLYAYFATAFHFVQLTQQTEDTVKTVSLKFYQTGAPIEAKVLEPHLLSEEGDLAVVYIPVAQLLPNIPPMEVRSASPSLPVHIIGHPPGNLDWTEWPGTVENATSMGLKAQFFATNANPTLTVGYSGGAVFDPDGHFIGMHLSGNNTYAHNLKATVLVETLKAWGVPTTNLK